MNFSRLRLGIGFAVLLGIATATAGLAQYGSGPAGAPGPAVTPVPATSAGPTRGKRAPAPASSGGANPQPSDTPEPPQFNTLDGIWEVELQPLGKRLANYTHMNIVTNGAALTGYYQDGPKKNSYPITGTFDGRLIQINVKMPNGSTAVLSGYVETFADMVGLFRTSDTDPGIAFTAEHRKKLKG